VGRRGSGEHLRYGYPLCGDDLPMVRIAFGLIFWVEFFSESLLVFAQLVARRRKSWGHGLTLEKEEKMGRAVGKCKVQSFSSHGEGKGRIRVFRFQFLFFDGSKA
jgi:hypothetical protein